MSVPTDPQRAAVPPHLPGNGKCAAVRTTFLLLLAAVVGPYVALQAPREIGRWHLAVALNLRSQDQKDAAYRELATAIGWFPQNAELLLQRAEWRLEDGQREEALADCDQMLEVGGETYAVLFLHSQFLQNAGEFARAVEDWKKIEQFSERSGIPSRETALNGLAYARALAKVDLDQALENSNAAVELQPANAALLDTRGFILHLQGADEQALLDLDRAVKGMDAEFELARRNRSGENAVPVSVEKVMRSRPKTLLELGNSVTSAARSAAVVHYHRALALSALDREQEANAERAIVHKLIGRDGDETLF